MRNAKRPRPLTPAMKRAIAWLAEVDKENTIRTFEDEAEAVRGDRSTGGPRAVARINAALSHRLGSPERPVRWPGSELVVHADGRVAGSKTLPQAVRLLRKRGIAVHQIGPEFYVDLPEDES